MPIEIRELNIRVNVTEQPSGESSSGTNKDVKKMILDTCADMIAESKRKSKER